MSISHVILSTALSGKYYHIYLAGKETGLERQRILSKVRVQNQILLTPKYRLTSTRMRIIIVDSGNVEEGDMRGETEKMEGEQG